MVKQIPPKISPRRICVRSMVRKMDENPTESKRDRLADDHQEGHEKENRKQPGPHTSQLLRNLEAPEPAKDSSHPSYFLASTLRYAESFL